MNEFVLIISDNLFKEFREFNGSGFEVEVIESVRWKGDRALKIRCSLSTSMSLVRYLTEKCHLSDDNFATL